MPARGINYPARIVPSLPGLILPTGQIHVIRSSSILPSYLLWYLNRRSTQDKIATKLTGSTIQSLKKSDLSRIEVEVPPRHVQEIIGELYHLDLQREIARRELSHLEAHEISSICESVIN
jgi:restriction endonuclease S subunit